MIYLDTAATSLYKPMAVEQAMVWALKTMASPGRGGHKPAMSAAEELFKCRSLAAEFFNVAQPEQVVFTFNATHGLNVAIKSMAKPGMPVLISGFEHNSVTRPLRAVGADINVFGTELFGPENAITEFKRQARGKELVVCTCVSNAFGYILPFREIARICREEKVPFILDASQAAGLIDLDFEGLGADFIAMPGHKGLMGPQGTGLLLCKTVPEPLMEGGSGSDSISQTMPEYLPDRLEAGTHNVPGIAGLAAGIEFIKSKGIDEIYRHEKMLLDTAASRLKESGLELFYSRMHQCGAMSFRHKSIDCESIAQSLTEKGICVRSGLHCAPLAHESAGTLESGTVRISFSPFLSQRQLETACDTICEII